MKRLIVLLVFISFTAVSQAQYTDIQGGSKRIPASEKTAGELLKSGSNSMLGGIVFTIAGAGLASYGASLSSDKNSSDADTRKICIGGGVVFGVLGFYLNLRGIVLIGKAGDKMKEKSLTLVPNPAGASLVFKF